MTVATMVTTLYSKMASPIGQLTLLSDGASLTALHMEHERELVTARAAAEGWVRDDDALHAARAQLEEYLAGSRTTFDLPVLLRGTPFQVRVWEALRTIPYGETVSYAEIARRIGNPTAVRAVGAANGRNPVAIIVPCHRVIGADGSLTGYGGGIERKQWLLAHERRVREEASRTD